MKKHARVFEGGKKHFSGSRYITSRVLLCFVTLTSFFLQQSKGQVDCAGLTTVPISYTGGVQNFVVPSAVTQIRISITGGSGGTASSSGAYGAGGGATVYAYIDVVPGDIFRVIIGQKGTNGTFHAGGGGSSAVYKNGTLIMVAGGGGGEDNTGNGGNGLADENGGNGGNDTGLGSSGGCGSSASNGLGGTGGNGGNHGEFSANCPHGGGGGGGLNSPGQGNGNLDAGQPGGQGNINGTAGGAGSQDDASGINGGWGWSGGGGADDRESGGGGGYSGGGGGAESAYPGGGGSFVATGFGITASGKINGSNLPASATDGINGSAIVCSSPAITLPVQLVSFTASVFSQEVLLKWQTSEELNNKGFTIERSANGIAWEAIGFIAAETGNGNAHHYQFTDNNPASGNNFYRLRQEDWDGRYEYSNTRTVQYQYNGKTLIFPNPATDILSILIQENKFETQIINSNGKIVRTYTNQKKLYIQSLPKGIYYLKLTYEGKTENLLFLKQ